LKEIKVVAKELDLEPLVIEGEELNKRGFGGIYNVGKAATDPPKLVVLSSLKPQAKKTVAWVGKGIVFDTGGLCIKSKTGMCTMKRDCGGAAAILGAFYTAIKMVNL
jgi:probable aminopeptidase NPEPL1